MALTNFILTVVGVGAAYIVLQGDVRRSAVTLRRNLKHIRHWLEQEHPSPESGIKAGQAKVREVEPRASEKTAVKEEKH